MKPIFRSYLIEVNLGQTVPGQGSNINIQDYPQLRNVYITGICAYDSNQVTTSPSGNAVVSTLEGLTLTLLDVFNMEMIYSYPLFDLNPFNMAGFYRDILPFRLQLIKSQITVQNNAGLNANESVIFNVFYIGEKEYQKYKSIYLR
jgi:hypothetical protein